MRALKGLRCADSSPSITRVTAITDTASPARPCYLQCQMTQYTGSLSKLRLSEHFAYWITSSWRSVSWSYFQMRHQGAFPPTVWETAPKGTMRFQSQSSKQYTWSPKMAFQVGQSLSRLLLTIYYLKLISISVHSRANMCSTNLLSIRWWAQIKHGA